jgi:hypothetical protein
MTWTVGVNTLSQPVWARLLVILIKPQVVQPLLLLLQRQHQLQKMTMLRLIQHQWLKPPRLLPLQVKQVLVVPKTSWL